MEVKDSFKLKQDKGAKKKVKCSIFFNKALERELAVHEDFDNTNSKSSAISDVNTGVRFVSIPKEISSVTDSIVEEFLQKFISHYTLEAILNELKKLEDEGYIKQVKEVRR